MSRTRETIISNYADGIAEFAALNEAQHQAVRAAMSLMYHELEHRSNEATVATLADMQHCRDEVARLNDYANGLKTTMIDQEVEIQRLRTQIALHTAPPSVPIPAPATITPNGTHPAPAVTVPPDPTQAPPAATKAAARTPGEFIWAILDDTSRELVQQLDDGQRAWRTLSEEDRRAITLGAITELQIQQPQGKTLSIEEFEAVRPIWMPGFATLSTSLGMTWKQMQRAAGA